MARLKFTQVEIDSENGSDEVFRTAMEALRTSAPAPITIALPLVEARETPVVEQASEPKHIAAPTLLPEPKSKAKRTAWKRVPQSEPQAVAGGGDSIGARILDALKLKPMSSLELANHLKMEPGKIYNPCYILKNSGKIVSRNSDATDGTRRYSLA